ncbi:MAG TPA: response regulator [Thermoanaerobaculia bacterium]|jgi:DNA-directed RNA polymerase specialized sigma24 family protein/CheY-like chemotaxis protein|nr:response regulator [Thermoanaerobaculia bacterium]
MTRILVVDDEPAIVAGIQALLALHGIETEAAWDANMAEERIAGEFFPIILADLRLHSEADGLRLIDSVRRISARSRLVTMTAYASPETEARLRERGSELVLHKPFLEDDLLAVLREMLQAVEAAEAAHPGDDDALYGATLQTLQKISRGRYGFAREDAEELVQETWLLFLEKRAGVRTPHTWLSGTIANLCRQEIGRRQLDRDRAAELPDLGAAPPNDDVLSVRAALAQLDGRSRSLCTMIGLEQRSYAEVSAATGIPLGSVGPLYLRAKERLRRAISN